MPALVVAAALVAMPVTPILSLVSTTTVLTVMQSMVLTLDTLSHDLRVSLGASLRDRAFRSNLRSLRSLQFPLQSLAPPFASLTARSACPAARSAHRRCRNDASLPCSTAPSAGPPFSPRGGAARRARRRPRLARPGRLRRQRASPRLAAAALRAPPVPASPDTSLRTAPCSSAGTGAVGIAIASGSVLRTTACGSGRTARHSIAVAAPLRRVPRRRFPLRSPSDSWLS